MAVSRLTQTTLQNGFEKFASVWDGRSAVGSMEVISAITLSAAQASVEFNNIPGTYSHLQLRIFARDTGNTGGTYSAIKLQLNNNTSSSSYAEHMLYGTGAAAGADKNANAFGWFYLETIPNAGSIDSANFSGGICDILDYSNTNKNKTMRWLGGHENNGTGSTEARKGFIAFKSGLWIDTAAITSIRLTADQTSFAINSSFSLYGIK